MTSSFWDHVEELRKAVLWSIGSILFSSMVVFFFLEPISSFIAPRTEGDHVKRVYILKERTIDLASGASTEEEIELSPSSLYLFGPLEGVSGSLRFSLFGGALFSSPIWMYILARFVIPALKPRERRWFFPLFLIITFGLVAGIWVGMVWTVPSFNSILQNFNRDFGINLWSYSLYLSYVLSVLLATVFFFEFMGGLFFLIHVGALSPKTLSKSRPYTIVFFFVISAIMTPPDIFSQAALAIPLICIYEVAIGYGYTLAKIRSFRSLSSI